MEDYKEKLIVKNYRDVIIPSKEHGDPETHRCYDPNQARNMFKSFDLDPHKSAALQARLKEASQQEGSDSQPKSLAQIRKQL